MFTLIPLTIFAALNFCDVNAGIGIDVARPINASTLQCLMNNDQYQGSFIGIHLATLDKCNVDANALSTTIPTVLAANMPKIDGYIFMCPLVCEPVTLIAQTLASIEEVGHLSALSTVWLNLEGGADCWPSGNTTINREILNTSLHALRQFALSIDSGLFTSPEKWQQNFGNSTEHADLMLWWAANDDNQPNFGNFQPFGGWTKPTLKQFRSNVTSTACFDGSSVPLQYGMNYADNYVL